MTALDIIVFLVVFGAAALGYVRGFVTEALSLLAWVLAVIALEFLHAPATDWLAAPVGTRGGAAVLAFAIVFGVTFIGGRLVARAIGRRTRESALGAFDRVLGIGFGALKGLVMATVLYLLLVTLVYDTLFGARSQRPDWMADSRTYPLLDATSRALVDFVETQRNPRGGDAAGNNAISAE